MPKKKYHIDMDFEGERVVDNDVEFIENEGKTKAYVYSPVLRANIIIPKKELRKRTIRRNQW